MPKGVYERVPRTTCQQGHPWSHTWVGPDGLTRNRCRTCNTNRERARLKRLRDLAAAEERRRLEEIAAQQAAAEDWDRRLRQYAEKLRLAEVEAEYQRRRDAAMLAWHLRVHPR